MDPGIVAAIIGAISAIVVVVLTAFFGIRSYHQQKIVDRRNYVAEKEADRKIELRNRRMKDYEEYLTAFRGYTSLYDFGAPPKDDSKERIAAVNKVRFAYSGLFQTASDRVLEAVIDFHKLAWLNQTDLIGEDYNREWRSLYAQMIMEMRTDAFRDTVENTKLEQSLIEDNLPFDLPQEIEPMNDEREEQQAEGRIATQRSQHSSGSGPGI